jgi:hypothetical protein
LVQRAVVFKYVRLTLCLEIGAGITVAPLASVAKVAELVEVERQIAD